MDEKSKQILGAGAAGALGYALGSNKASGAPGGNQSVNLIIDDETKGLLAGLLEALGGLNIPDNQAPQGLTVDVQPLKNNPDIICFTVVTTGVLTAINLPEYEVPDNKELVIKALPTNLGLIYVAGSGPNAVQPNQAYWLIGNEGVGYRVTNTKAIWIASTLMGEGVTCTMEYKG